MQVRTAAELPLLTSGQYYRNGYPETQSDSGDDGNHRAVGAAAFALKISRNTISPFLRQKP